jgi:hypothetical protein
MLEKNGGRPETKGQKNVHLCRFAQPHFIRQD